MAEKSAVKTDKAPAAIGPYSQAVKIGDFLFCSGQIPLNPENMELEKADIVLQTKRVLANMKAVLEAAGSSPAKVVKTMVFMTDLGNFATVNQEYQAFFEREAPGAVAPARSAVEVSALPKGSLIEIEAIATL